MAAFAEQMRMMGAGYLDNPVVDRTGLQGSWDFDIKWTDRGQLATAGANAVSIFDAVDKQLGLKLDLQRVLAPVIVVDSVNEKPTANPPGVTRSLPPAPIEFEVADVQPSAPGTDQTGGFQPGGRMDLKAFSLKDLIMLAWSLNSDEMIMGAPKWLDSERFDIVAKASTAALTAGPKNEPSPGIALDTLRLMLRALLVDRFKMTTHYETRPVSAYALVPAKPKLTKADPSNRTRCKEGPGADGKDPRNTHPMLSRLVSCQNMTMAQFAEQLPTMSEYVQTSVADATGLEGAWDFTLSFSSLGMTGGGDGRSGDARPSSATSTAAATEPNGALSLFDAVERQLGLKLKLQKRSLPILVIDHVEQKPTDN
jgi:uncharacterized protein (TIGR03435 family)